MSLFFKQNTNVRSVVRSKVKVALRLETIGRAILDACIPLGVCLHRMTDWLRLEETSRGHLVQPSVLK